MTETGSTPPEPAPSDLHASAWSRYPRHPRAARSESPAPLPQGGDTYRPHSHRGVDKTDGDPDAGPAPEPLGGGAPRYPRGPRLGSPASFPGVGDGPSAPQRHPQDEALRGHDRLPSAKSPGAEVCPRSGTGRERAGGLLQGPSGVRHHPRPGTGRRADDPASRHRREGRLAPPGVGEQERIQVSEGRPSAVHHQPQPTGGPNRSVPEPATAPGWSTAGDDRAAGALGARVTVRRVGGEAGRALAAAQGRALAALLEVLARMEVGQGEEVLP